jgi:cytosine/adenosine deaminase-related metal-dependent hydrolase
MRPIRLLSLVLVTLAACSSEAPTVSDAGVPGFDGGDGASTDTTAADAGGPRSDAPAGDSQAGDVPVGDGGMSSAPPRVTTCPGDALPALATGTCQVTAGTAGTLITGDVLTPGEVFRGGQVLVDAAGVIRCVGCDCSAAAGAAEATRVVCPDGVVSPGLINAHDHLTFAQNAPYTRTAERYEHRHDWRRGGRGHTRLASAGSATNDQVAWGELRFVLGGATAVNGSGGVAGFLRNLDRGTMDGLGQPPVRYETFPLGDSGGQLLATGCGYPAINTAADIAGVDAYTPHVAEGIGPEARNEFTCIRMGATDLVQPQSAFVHGVGLLPPDISEMATHGTALIWSPRSNVTLYGDTAHVTEYARLGVPIALGSDWIISGSMNMLRELRCADSLDTNFYGDFFTDEALWLMATRDAAAALAVDDAIGVIATGRTADLAIFNGATHRDHRAVIDAAPGDVTLVLRGGAALYGDAAVVAALPGGAMCDPLDVCGVGKRVCVARDLGGRNLAALTSANSTRYPLFFCGEPMNEPSCLPERNAMGALPNPVVSGSTRYSGVSSAQDVDGDGLANAMDDCPRVFNPVRPVDNGTQGDSDHDGVGDACDPCPLNPDTASCMAPDPNDRDGDGIPNERDNCPDTRNPDQSDRDMDGRGDVCDPCPMAANPNGAACPATVYAIKTAMVAMGARVTVVGPVVTALARNGFYAQVAPDDPAYTAPENSGIFVFTGTAPMVVVGDRVTLTNALIADFFGQAQLSGAIVTATAHGIALPPPVAVTPAEIATPAAVDGGIPAGSRAAALEGVLVRAAALTVTSAAPTPLGGDVAPTNEFEVNAALRVDDAFYVTTPFPVTGETFASITGVLTLSRGNYKLNPRSADDLVAGAAQLVAFPAGPFFARVGPAAPTLPAVLAVQLTRAVATATTVTIRSSDPGLVVADVVIPAGSTRAVVPMMGITAAATPYTVTATLGTSVREAPVRVIAANAAPHLTSLTPATITLGPGTSGALTVTLDLPAPAGGTTVMLGTTAGGSIPATVVVPADALSAEVSFTAGAMGATATVTATLGTDARTAMVRVTDAPVGTLVINEVDYDQVGADTGEFVEIYNGALMPVDLSTVVLVLVNGSTNREYARVALSGTLGPGAYAVVANAAVTVPAGVARFAIANDSIQNGSPDGVALINTATGSLLDALSYEGPMSAATITGVTGTVSLVEGTVLPATVADSNTMTASLVRLPNGSDTDDAATDWRLSAMPTPGAANAP